MLRAAVSAIALATLALPAAAQQRPPPPAAPRQRPPAQQAQQPAAQQPEEQAPAAGSNAALREQIREELEADFEARLETLREEMRDEVRAAVTSAGAAEEWEDEWEDVRPKLDFLEMDGYFRTRMDVFNNFSMDTGADPAGFHIFPVDPEAPDSATVAGANMRLRVLPTLNVSEEVRIKAAVNVFDNLVLGATPNAGFFGGFGNQRDPYAFNSQSQATTTEFGFNSISDSIYVQRAWAEVRTPIGELRFGRMPTEFGLGMNWNDGNCLDCDHGDTVDRIMFATKIANHVIAPALDFVSEGPTSADPFTSFPTAQPFDRSQIDDGRDYVLAILRRDTDEEMARMRTAGRDTFINYGVYLTYRTQQWDVPELQVGGPGNGNAGGGSPNAGEGYPGAADPTSVVSVRRDAWAVQPDLWFRLITGSYRLELEFVTVQGEFGVSPAERAEDPLLDPGTVQNIDLSQYGAVLQNELKLVDDKLAIGLELGFASGDEAPGFGNFPGRPDNFSADAPFPQRGDWEGSQFRCGAATCDDSSIDNFRFDRDYHVDLILFREILGGVTDATYIKPSASYSVTEGLDLALAVIYSQANSAGTTPTRNKPLGVEIDAAINYLSDDGFVASIAYGVLFPMSGLDQLETAGDPDAGTRSAGTAQAVRGFFGVVY